MSLKGTPSTLKLVNMNKVERFILEHEYVTKPQIAAGTQISLVTVTKLVNDLLEKGKIIPAGTNESTGGRHAQRYRVNPDAHYAIGMYYVKGTFIGVVVNVIGEIVLRRKFHVDVGEAQSLLQQLCEGIDTLMQVFDEMKAVAIGIGVPGVEVDGTLENIPSLPEWEGFPLAAELEARYEIPVLLENDLNLTAMGMYVSEYEDSVRDMMVIYLDEGVGAGIMLNGSLFKGKTNFAGELGYIPVNIPEAARESNHSEKERLEVIINRLHRNMKQQEPNLQKILLDVLAQAMTSIVSVINPEVIAIKSSLLTEEVLVQLGSIVSDTVGDANASEIILLSEIETYGLDGIAKMCTDHTDISLRL